ncbi:MAG: MerR family transcriptional regulator [Nodularia sp. CChRGM 3473]
MTILPALYVCAIATISLASNLSTYCPSTGRSIYYSKTNLVELAAMVYWLSVGLSFDIACETLKKLKEQEPELFSSGTGRRFMLLPEAQDNSLSLIEFDREKAIASLDEGKPVIPVWLDVIYQQLVLKLETS